MIENEPLAVILRGELARDVILDILWDSTTGSSDFKELYELVGQFPGDPSEDYYQGRTVTTVIRRKSDDRLFGYSFWEGGGKYGEPDVEPNGEDLGVSVERDSNYEAIGGEVYVFLPVREFSVKGYVTEKP